MKSSRVRIIQKAITKPTTASPDVANVQETIPGINTGPSNDDEFVALLLQAVNAAKQQQHLFALLMVEIDNLKQLSASLGEDGAKILIKTIDDRFKKVLRDVDTVVQFDGNRFAIILHKINKFIDASLVASRLLSLLETPLTFPGQEIALQASMGIAIYPSDGYHIQELSSNAEMALAKAKKAGGNTYLYFSGGKYDEHNYYANIVSDLRYALENDKLYFHFQPIFSLEKKACMGLEAFLRWDHPTLGTIEPHTFIPVAEKSGLIIPIGEWTLPNICKQIVVWQKLHSKLPRVFINISTLQLQRKNFLKTVQSTLKSLNVQPNQIGFDLTDISLLQDWKQTQSCLEQLQKLGVQVAIDDFGTGYSSLNYFKQLSVNYLKIDRSFIHGIPDSPKDTAIVSSLINLCSGVNIGVIAEGIETEEQLEFLLKNGCSLGQGFLLAKPMPISAIDEFLKTNL